MASTPAEKRCSTCGETKPASEFNRNRSHSTGLQGRCRVCDQERARRNYANGTYNIKIYEGRKRRAAEQRIWIWTYLLNNPCVDCGESDPIVLEFDHVRGEKSANVSSLIGGSYSLSKIQQEVSKCDVRCANCHRRKTATDLGWFAGDF